VPEGIVRSSKSLSTKFQASIPREAPSLNIQEAWKPNLGD